MTALDASSVPAERDTRDPIAPLRQLVVADAIVTGLSGVLLLVAAEDLADWAGLTTAGPVRLIGGFFVLLAVALAGLGRTNDRLLVRLLPANAIGDLLWAAASVVVAVAAELSGAARAVILVQAVIVLAVGEAKLMLSRRARAATLS
jgi:glucose uptake protein GlcU